MKVFAVSEEDGVHLCLRGICGTQSLADKYKERLEAESCPEGVHIHEFEVMTSEDDFDEDRYTEESGIET